ncbi:MAG: hypothetical protein ACLTV6_12400, partial [Christensenellales bacterium]
DYTKDSQVYLFEEAALRGARQEEELERENALAIERQKRRQERLQKQKEEQEAAAKEAAEQEKRRQQEEEMRRAFEPEEPDQASEPPKTTRRKEKPTLTVVRPQEDERTDDRPVLTSRPPKRNAAPRKRREISDGAQLYIERTTNLPARPWMNMRPQRRAAATASQCRKRKALFYGMNGSQPRKAALINSRRQAMRRPTHTASRRRVMRRPTHTVSRRQLCADRRIRPADGVMRRPTRASQPTNEEPTVEPDVGGCPPRKTTTRKTLSPMRERKARTDPSTTAISRTHPKTKKRTNPKRPQRASNTTTATRW